MSSHIPTPQRIHAGQQTRRPDHIRHELCRVAAYTEERQAVVFDEALEDGMGCQPHVMPVAVLEHTAQRDEGLDVAAGADDVHYYVQDWRRWRCRGAGRGWQGVGELRMVERVFIGLGLAQLLLQVGDQGLREPGRRSRWIDVDAAVVWSHKPGCKEGFSQLGTVDL